MQKAPRLLPSLGLQSSQELQVKTLPLQATHSGGGRRQCVCTGCQLLAQHLESEGPYWNFVEEELEKVHRNRTLPPPGAPTIAVGTELRKKKK